MSLPPMDMLTMSTLVGNDAICGGWVAYCATWVMFGVVAPEQARKPTRAISSGFSLANCLG